MSTKSGKRCDQAEEVSLYALEALPPTEAAAVEAHLGACPECRREIETLRRVVDSFVAWPTDVLRPAEALWGRLARRIAAETGEEPASAAPRPRSEAEWEKVAPGISCKLLATDIEMDRVSLLVRLEPGVCYPPHHHAGVEELHLLHGELWIDDKKLRPGDYNRAPPGSADKSVWSETGCTCLLITSSRDALIPHEMP